MRMLVYTRKGEIGYAKEKYLANRKEEIFVG